jgi:hypothetical protein
VLQGLVGVVGDDLYSSQIRPTACPVDEPDDRLEHEYKGGFPWVDAALVLLRLLRTAVQVTSDEVHLIPDNVHCDLSKSQLAGPDRVPGSVVVDVQDHDAAFLKTGPVEPVPLVGVRCGGVLLRFRAGARRRCGACPLSRR